MGFQIKKLKLSMFFPENIRILSIDWKGRIERPRRENAISKSHHTSPSRIVGRRDENDVMVSIQVQLHPRYTWQVSKIFKKETRITST